MRPAYACEAGGARPQISTASVLKCGFVQQEVAGSGPTRVENALRPMPSASASVPASWEEPNGSPNMNAPRAAPTSGSRFTTAPATSGATRACPYAYSANGSSEPNTARARKPHSSGPGATAAGTPSAKAANGSTTIVPASICTTVTATGSRPVRTAGCATTYAAAATAEANISASPASEAPPPAPATRPTPATAIIEPAQDCGVELERPRAAAISAT